MPTYEYRCKKGHVFERLQKMSDAPLRHCERCNSAVERQIGAGVGFIFKGSGFYSTDYKKSAPLTKDTKPKAETKAPSSPEAKPSPKPTIPT